MYNFIERSTISEVLKCVTSPPSDFNMQNKSTPTIYSKAQISALQPESFPLPIQPNEPFKGDITWHTLFSSTTTPTNSLSAGVATCPPQTGYLCAHRHSQAEVYYITQGKGIMRIDEKENEVEEGSAVFIPGDAEHSIRNVGEEALIFFYVFATDAFEDVVYRFS